MVGQSVSYVTALLAAAWLGHQLQVTVLPASVARLILPTLVRQLVLHCFHFGPFWTISRVFLGAMPPPHAPCDVYSTWCPCLPDAEWWCLRYDVMTNARLQAGALEARASYSRSPDPDTHSVVMGLIYIPSSASAEKVR